jgi:hypothetical protein
MYFDINQVTFWNHQHFIAIALYLYCYFVGSSLLPISSSHHKNQTDNIYLHLFFSISLGLSLLIAGLFLVGITGFLKTTPVVLLMLALLAIPAWRIYHHQSFPFLSYLPKHKSLLSILTSIEFWFLLATLILLLFLSSGIPGLSDDTMYQLPHARAYLQKGDLSLNPHIHLPLIAQNGILLFAWSFIFGNSILAQMIATLPLFLLALGFLGISQALTKTTWVGMVAQIIFMSQVTISQIAGFAFVDILACSLTFAAIVALFVYLQKPGSNQGFIWIVLSGLFFGTALGTKIHAVPLIAMAVGILFYHRQYKATIYFLALVFLFGSPWYIRSWIISGNPIHPLASSIFGHFLYTAQDDILIKNERALFDSPTYWIALQKISGINLLASFFSIFFIRRMSKELVYCLIIWSLGLVFWFNSMPHDRYLIGFMPYACLLMGFSLWQVLNLVSTKSIFRKINMTLTTSVLCLLVFLFIVIPKAVKIHPIRFTNPSSFLFNIEAGGFAGYTVANQIWQNSDEPLLNIHFYRGIFFFNGTVLGSWFGSERYKDFCVLKPQEKAGDKACQLVSPPQLIAKMKQLGTRFVLVNNQYYDIPEEYPSYFKLHYREHETLLMSIKE